MTERLTADVTIIGGGVAGCAAAVALRRAGMTVVLLEKGMCGAGASGVNFGGVRQQGRNLAELPLARRSREIWDRLDEMLGEDVEFQATGHIKLARSDADMAELERYARDAADYGLKLQMLGANATRAELPWLGQKVVGASLCAEDGAANPRLVGPAYRAPRAPARRGSARASAGDCGRAGGRAFRDPGGSAHDHEPLPRQHGGDRCRQGRGLVRRGGAARAGRAQHAGDGAACPSS